MESYAVAAIAASAYGATTGLVLLVAQDKTRTNVAAAAAMVAGFVDLGVAFPLADHVSRVDPGLGPRLAGLVEPTLLWLSSVYMLSLLASSRLTGRPASLVRVSAWAGAAIAAWHCAISVAFPAQRLDDYALAFLEPGALSRPGFWLFATSWLASGTAFLTGWTTLARRGLDAAESARAGSLAVTAVAVLVATVAPPWVGLGVVLFAGAALLWGQVQYATASARRSVFLGRFLAPEVNQLVHAEGLEAVMKPHHVELTVIEADLRDFTPYAEAVPSQAVVDLLREYYEVVGEVVAEQGATIVSYAGDGVLILVGAPLPRDDHATAGLALANQLFPAVQRVLDRWSTPVHPLGLGVGMASGTVTVGAIGSEGRMEYTAVGTTVNLAARLCSSARAGEILIDEQAADMARHPGVVARDPMKIKGLSELQSVYALTFG